MAKQTINIGTMADNKSGDPLRTAFTKINQNFTELYDRPVGGNTNEVSSGIHGMEYGVPTAISATGTGLQYGTTYTYGDTIISIEVADGSVTAVNIQRPGSSRSQGEVFTIAGENFGGVSPDNDVTVTIDTVVNYSDEVVLDVTKNVHVIEAGQYVLPDGTEGQVMHFVPKQGLWIKDWGDVTISITNCRYGEEGVIVDQAYWIPFYKGTDTAWVGKQIATAVFADGAWAVNTGVFD